MSVKSNYTPTEQRMLRVLSDGLPHTRQELHSCLSDPLCELSRIQMPLSRLRRKLQASGQDVLCELYQGRPHYRQVILMPKRSPAEGD